VPAPARRQRRDAGTLSLRVPARRHLPSGWADPDRHRVGPERRTPPDAGLVRLPSAFRWPLPYGGAREAHEIRFERPEPGPTRLLSDGLLGPSADGTPVEGDRLRLRDALFEAGALVFDRVASRKVAYGVPGRRSIQVAFPDMPHLGIWTKPGAGFVCIEPWQGHADPVGFDGELVEKPGVVLVEPGEARQFSMEISVPP
jgi:hypothetical protein